MPPTPLLVTALLVCLLPASLWAQDVPPAREGRRHVHGEPSGEGAGDRSILERAHATGEWWGLRDWLHERGVDPELFVTTDGSVVASGGVDPGGTALRSLVDASVSVDGGRLLGWQGARFFANLQIQRGTDGSTDAGDLQAFSNIDGDDRTQLAVAWYEQMLFDDALRLKIGKADANTDFAFVEHGFDFLNSSFGFSPTVVGFPTYPDPAFGVVAFVQPGGGFYAGAGVYDGAGQAGFKTGQRGPDTLLGAPSDLFAVTEFGRRWEDDGRLGAGRLGIGAFRHTGDFARFDGGVERGTAGGYLVLDQMLWRPADAGESARGIGGLLQYGWADPDISPIEHHAAVGVAWTGPFARRPEDVAGLGATWAAFSGAPSAGLVGAGELAVEAFYALQLTPWARLEPDLQYIYNPGGLGVDDALVLSLRMIVTF